MVDSAPCNNCLNLILTLKIKRIVFSSTNNNIISIDPRLLDINHVSSGSKFFTNSKISYNNEGELRNGMILSNEPGFYKKNKYGIRIENLIIIKSKTKKFSQFETISFAPIDRDLIDLNILSKLEIDWLNQYHAEVFKKLKNKLDTKERAWLREVTKPL